MENGILYFLLFSSDHSLALNSLPNHFFFNELFIDMSSSFFTHLCNNRVHLFIFQAKIYKNIINYFIKKSANAYVIATKPLVFTVNFKQIYRHS